MTKFQKLVQQKKEKWQQLLRGALQKKETKLKEKKFEKYKKLKLCFPPGTEKLFTQEEAEHIFAEVIRRVVWETGEEWLNAHAGEEVNQIIIKKAREVAEAYFKRQEKEKLIDKIADILMENLNK